MRKALYREYRPLAFNGDFGVVGQEHITSVLAWQCKNNRTSHAYLFCGSRGTGKTTCAKILAKAVNCLSPRDGNPCNECPRCRAANDGTSLLVYEMDAASNTGVDYVREIREEIVFSPATEGVKVYIIDEVHMLSEGAFNALLKTLEEPPSGVMFILATTEARKIPSTILSRCQRFDFRRISNDIIVERLELISEREGIKLEREAAELIAKIAQGGMRDAISMLEHCAKDGSEVSAESVKDAVGVFGREIVISMVAAIAEKNAARVLSIISDVYYSSKDIAVFIYDIIEFYRDMTVCKGLSIKALDSESRAYFDLTTGEFEEVKKYASFFTYEKLLYHYKLLSDAYTEINRAESKRLSAEMVLLRMASDRSDMSVEALVARVAELERMVVKSGGVNTSYIEGEKNDAQSREKSVAEHKAHSSEDTEKNSPTEQKLHITRAVWNALIDKFSEIDPPSAPFVKKGKPVNEGSVLVIEVPSFFIDILKRANAENTLTNILKNEDIRYTKVELRGVSEVTNSPITFIDELL